MKKLLSTYFLAVILFLLIGFCSSLTVSADETFFLRSAEEQYFPTYLTTRSLGMGGVYSAFQGDILSLFGNPAGLASLTNTKLDLTFQHEWMNGDDLNTFSEVDRHFYRGFALVATPITDNFGIGAGVMPSYSDTNDLYDTETEGFQIPLVASYQLSPEFSVGYGLSYYNYDLSSLALEGQNNSAFKHRFGILYTVNDGLTLGLTSFYGHADAVSSVITGAHFDGNRESWGLRGGASWNVMEDLLWSTDVGFQSNDLDGSTSMPLIAGFVPVPFSEELGIFSVNTGLEYALNESITVRGGAGYYHYDYDTNDPTLTNIVNSTDIASLSAGFSYMFTETFRTDIGTQVRFFDEVDVVSGISLTFDF